MLHPSGKGEGDGKQVPAAAVDEFHELYARQRDVANAVKRARVMALMPYAVPSISGCGDRRNRG